jgi:hypothetical protein
MHGNSRFTVSFYIQPPSLFGDIVMISATSRPVPEHSAEHVNAEIRRRTDESVLSYAEHSVEIDDRLWELDNEWDIERTLEANAAAFSLLGLTLALTVDRRWLALPIGVAAFLLQHVVQGWCPPVPVFRRLGFRTVAEIDEERYALKVLRATFKMLRPPTAPRTSGRGTPWTRRAADGQVRTLLLPLAS